MPNQVDLWSSNDGAVWAKALAAYGSVVVARSVTRLVELDAWYRDSLPLLLGSRSPSYVTREELLLITEWKMKRGVWRARNLALVEGNTDEAVRAASEAALRAIPDPRRPLVELDQLAGVGPATSSAVLAAVRPDLYPFFDELVAAQIPDLGTIAFTLPNYVRYAERLRARAEQLPPHATRWNADEVARAIWATTGGTPPLR